MSQGEKKYPYPMAAQLAQFYLELITPFCQAGMVQIVGSVRRHKAEVGDLEILAIPVPEIVFDLFSGDGHNDTNLGNNLLQHNLPDVLNRHGAGWSFEKNGPKYKRIKTREGICLDLYLSTLESWPVELAIRTGPAEFSHKCVMPRRQGGWLPSDCRVREHWQVFRNAKLLQIGSERQFLNLLGLGWVEPWDRTANLVCGDPVFPGRPA